MGPLSYLVQMTDAGSVPCSTTNIKTPTVLGWGFFLRLAPVPATPCRLPGMTADFASQEDDAVSGHAAKAWPVRTYPHAVMCLLSALRRPALITRSLLKVWLGFPASPPRHRRAIRHDAPSVVLVGHWLREPGNTSRIAWRCAQPTSCMRADYLGLRRKIGRHVATGSRQDAWGAHRLSPDRLWRYATLGRATSVMCRPYIKYLS